VEFSLSKNKLILQSVQNGLSIINLFSKDKPVWSLTEISLALELPKSSASRLIGDLLSEGFLIKKGKTYSLGLPLLSLAGIVSSHLEIKREAERPIASLVEKIEETSHLTILEGTRIVYLLKKECSQPVRLLSYLGKDHPAVCTSSGIILLAHLPPEKASSIIGEGLPKMGPNSFADAGVVLMEISKARNSGYAVCIDVLHDDVVSIAAPIKDYYGSVIAAVSSAGPKHRIDQKKIELMIQEIIKTADKISTGMGYL
jgi:IclR family transcriptional regulator, KDG regulon repressor